MIIIHGKEDLRNATMRFILSCNYHTNVILIDVHPSIRKGYKYKILYISIRFHPLRIKTRREQSPTSIASFARTIWRARY